MREPSSLSKRVSSPKVNPDKKIPKFEDWNELKFVVFLRRQDYSIKLGKLGINGYITSK